MKNKLKYVIGGGVLTLLSTVVMWWSWEKETEKALALQPEVSSSISVDWEEVVEEEISDWLVLEGIARAERKVRLAFEVEGKIEAIGESIDGQQLREGMWVQGPNDGEKGQLIAMLDSRDYLEEYQKTKLAKARSENEALVSKAELERAISHKELAQSRFDRISKLKEKGLSSIQAFDERRSQLISANAELIAAKSRYLASRSLVEEQENSLAQAKRNFERTRIYAPWSGQIARMNIKVGDYISISELNTQTDTITTASFPVTLVDPSSFEVSVEVPANGLNNLKPGNPALIQKQRTSPKNPESADRSWFEASVYSVAPILSPDTRTVRVIVKTSKDNPPLIDGELLRVKVERQRKKALVISVNSIIYRNNIPHVFVVDRRSRQVLEKQVKLGIRDEKKVEIVKGLTSNEVVVTDGRHRLTSGDYVHLIQKVTIVEGRGNE
ncbi:efflux RND transporter periplasmic adaptor subunit [Vibrio alginolyticus]|nr:efflux RND transporter periplasmic adaptor subunit [Vibrio alginolyticus]EMD1213670.1 efflux RND transporter periplasmic adaptor subunit [Vibrio alginolyticus]